MHFPKETIPGSKLFNATSDVYLEAAHVCIKKNIADKIFSTERVVLSVYYEKDKTFMIVPSGDELFRKLHKVTQQLFKTKNINGDKSVSIKDLLIDNNIDSHDRDLEFVAEEALHILKIKL